MAVESRFVVIRHGVEVQTFMDKKAADDYDKMLDMADNLTAMLNATPFELSDEIKEELSIYLAQNREDVLVALQAKKAKPTSQEAPTKAILTKNSPAKAATIEDEAPIQVENTVETVVEEKPVTKKTVKKTKTKTASDIANTPTE